MAVIFIGVISIILLGIYALDLIKHGRFKTKEIVMIGLVAAISFVLSLIQFFKLPQGGTVSLCSMLPIMLFALAYGRVEGVTAGLILGGLSLIFDFYVIHPVQLIFDYMWPFMALGLAGVFGNDTRLKRIMGCLFAVSLCVLAHFISGVVFFGEYAPEGMGVVLYSFLYNFLASGVEGIISTIIIAILPFERIQNQIKDKSNITVFK